MQNFKKDQQIPLVQVTDPSTGQTYYAPQNVVYQDKNNTGATYLRDVIVDQAVTASYFSGSILNAISASYALTASYALNAGGTGTPFRISTGSIKRNMATWKKVIVSGSTANLAALQVDNLTSGQVVIGGGTSNLSTTAINGTGNIVATTNATGLVHSGSFSGSFQGNGAGLTGVTATPIFPTTVKTDLASTDQFFINDGANKYVTYGNLLTDLAGTNLAVEGTDSLTLATTITGITSITSTSFTGSHLGNTVGTASWATNAVTATTATNANNVAVTDTTTGTGPYYIMFADGTTGNRAVRVDSSTLTFNATTNTLTVTSSYANQALSASYAASVNNLTNAITNNADNRVLTATGGGTINGEGNLTFDGTTLTVTGNQVLTGNLTVQGTASFQQTTNLEVADRFVLFASGSNTAGDGGIVVQQATQNVGELFAYENSVNRWGFTSSFNASSPSYTAAAFVTTTEVGTTAPPVAPIYGGASNGLGNIYVRSTTEEIFIYS
jgi:hypothetical protein